MRARMRLLVISVIALAGVILMSCLMSCGAGLAYAASGTVTHSGTTMGGINYEVYDDGTLLIWGTQSSEPDLWQSGKDWGWYDYKSQITSVGIKEGESLVLTNCYSMFYMYSNLTSIDLSGADTSQVQNMNEAFHCSKLTSINVSDWDTSSVTNMTNAIYSTRLTKLDLSGWDCSSLTTHYSFVKVCTGLKKIKCPNVLPGHVIASEEFADINRTMYDADDGYAATTKMIAGHTLVSSVPHSLTYDLNGGEYIELATNDQKTAFEKTYSLAQGDRITLLPKHFWMKDGYTTRDLAVFNTKPDGSGTSYGLGATFTMGSEPVVLYVQYNKNPVVRFYYNGGKDESFGFPAESSSKMYPYFDITGTTTSTGAYIIESDLPEPVREGYVLKGWNTKADGSGVNLDLNALPIALGLGEVRNYYALWDSPSAEPPGGNPNDDKPKDDKPGDKPKPKPNDDKPKPNDDDKPGDIEVVLPVTPPVNPPIVPPSDKPKAVTPKKDKTDDEQEEPESGEEVQYVP